MNLNLFKFMSLINLSLSSLYDTFKQFTGLLPDPFISPKRSLLFHREMREVIYLCVIKASLLVDGYMLICCHANRSYMKHGLNTH